MKVIIVGGVAAGTKAAAKLRRLDPECEVKLLTKDAMISYAGCGMPYYIGDVVEDAEELVVNTPAKFTATTGVKVITGCEVIAVDKEKKTVTTLMSGERTEESYDKLVLAVGASAVVPKIEGTTLPGVFVLRDMKDAEAIKTYAKNENCRKAVVAGAGYVGIEIAENLKAAGMSVALIEKESRIMPGILDADMADYVERHLKGKGLRILTGTELSGINGQDKVTGVQAGEKAIDADLVILSLGVRPATGFLAGAGIELDDGAIVVNEKMETSAADIYAAGDCVVVKNLTTGAAQRSLMGSTANITGRMLAANLTGEDKAYPGCLGTGIARVSDELNVGRTGLTMEQAKAAGFDPESATAAADMKPHYYPDSTVGIVKVIADKVTHKLLGIQAVSAGPVDKMTDIAALGISKGMTIEEFDYVDFAYAPPFSTAIHPFVTAIYVLENKLSGAMESFTPLEYLQGMARDYEVIDSSRQPAIPGVKYVTPENLTAPVPGLDPEAKILIVCTKGRRAYLVYNKLKALGYTNVKVLEGGQTMNVVKAVVKGNIPADEVKRLKGLGCLIDKRTMKHFNIRIITVNGKVTAAQYKVIAEAAEKFGSGDVAMTTRLTIEIQAVPYENTDACIAFLNENGILTGGTGSLVRPVVSCKGTTCQYGLIDTFGLSQKLHDEFYIKWHKVTLPHKFKIAVGGCPNNCVKPNLNDVGIIGQRVPRINADKCRGCNVCQVVNTCPVKIAKIEDGKIHIPFDQCNNCGICLNKCPFGAMEEEAAGYKIYVGGRWGKRVKQAEMLGRLLTSEEEVMQVVENVLLLFRDEGITGERLSDTVERLGLEYVENKVLNEKQDKDKILKKTVKGGATC